MINKTYKIAVGIAAATLLVGGLTATNATANGLTAAPARAVNALPVGDLFMCVNNTTKVMTQAWSFTVCPAGTTKYVVLSSTGAKGAKGDKGDSGAPGVAGPTGATGATGPAGATGNDGATGAKGATGATGAPGVAGTKGDPGAAGADGKDGANGTNAPAATYGIAKINVSRGGATATTWQTLSTALGSPVGDTASGTFRFTCSAAKAPCALSVSAYATTSGVVLYPRVLINKSSIDTGAPLGQCEYGDGTDNNGGTAALTGSAAPVTLGIGGSLDCGSAQAYPATGIVSTIEVPAGYYDVTSTMQFVKS